MRLPRFVLVLAVMVMLGSRTDGAEPPKFVAQEIDPKIGNVCYALCVADVNADGKPDVVAVSEDALVWYENGDWTRHDMIRGVLEKDHVCVQPHDIDGDGRIDFVVGAGWRPPNTERASSLQWIGRDSAGTWQVHPIDYTEPTLHRLRLGDVKGNGKTQLVVAPLQGRGTKGPNWGEGQGVQVQVFDIPADPTVRAWPVVTADDALHTIHNLQLIDLTGDGRSEMVLAAWEGVFRLDLQADGKWSRTKLGAGNQESSPFKGSSEVKVGRLANGGSYIATIEPWHGHQVVAYSPSKSDPQSLWTRSVLAEPLTWGHAVWCANLDDDADEELIIGQRDRNPAGSAAPAGPGVFVFDPQPGSDGTVTFARWTVDDGGMGCEDALAADLDGDGRNEIIAGGRSTHNVKIYWNRAK